MPTEVWLILAPVASLWIVGLALLAFVLFAGLADLASTAVCKKLDEVLNDDPRRPRN